ncbi:MAG: sensor histidine kinase [Bacteroidia bacterium]
MTLDKDIFLAIICSTLLILLLIAAVVITFFISGKKQAQQEMILVQTKLSFEKELRQVESEVTDHVKTQFARELHDNIGQLLTAMHYQIESQKIDHPQLADTFKPAEIYLAEITQQLKLLSRTLNNDHIGHVGLFTSLDNEVERLRALKQFQLHWTHPEGSTNLDKNQELMVFRIFQEIAQNALRHASAHNLYITAYNGNGVFELTIKDDGKGFISEQVLLSPKASGLKNIIKRAELAGLSCEIISSPGNGCIFKLAKQS